MKDRIIFSDEAVVHTSCFVNRKNCIIWVEEKPHIVQEYVRNSPKVNVWWGVCADGIIDPYFHEGESVNGPKYLELLKDFLFENMPLSIRRTAFFQQDGVNAHYILPVRRFLKNSKNVRLDAPDQYPGYHIALIQLYVTFGCEVTSKPECIPNQLLI